MRLNTLLAFILPASAIPSALYTDTNVASLVPRDGIEYPGWKTDIYARDPEALIAALEHLEYTSIMRKRKAIAPNNGPGEMITSAANFISTLTTGCPRKGTKDYAQCKRCKEQNKKRDLEEREAEAKGGKGSRGAKPKGNSRGKDDKCSIWR